MSGTIEAMTAALIANTEALVAHNAILTAMMDKAGTKPAAAATTAASTTAAADKPKGTTKPAGAKKAETVTLAGLKEAIGVWLGASPKGSAENKAKSEMLKKILESVGADKVTNIAADKVAEANALFVQVKNGEDPFAEEVAEEEAEAEDELL